MKLVIPAKAGIQYAAPPRSITSALEYWIIRRSLSSGGHSADPLADDDGGVQGCGVAYRRSRKKSFNSVAASRSPTAE